MSDRPDIFLFTIDALRADHLSCHGHHRETPFFDSLADRTISFSNAFSVSSHTREAMPPLLSGKRPSEFAANGFTQVPEEETLAGRLRAEGYTTGGFHSNPYLSRAYGFGAGFDEFYDDLVLGQNKIIALAQQALDRFVLNRGGQYYARAPEINERSLDWLGDADGPVFLWNHYMDPHGPYHAPKRHYAERELSAREAESLYRRSWKKPDSITDEEQQLLRDSYDDEIRYLDGKLESFFDELEQRDRLEDAVVIVTADHGDAFGEHGYYTHPRYLHDTLLHVPLFVSPPGSSVMDVDNPVSTLDVVPTILDQVDGSFGGDTGTPLVTSRESSGFEIPDREDHVFASATGEDEDKGIRRFAARGKRWKVLLKRDIETEEIVEQTVYDCENDPGEQDPRRDSGNEQAVLLLERVEQFSRDQPSQTADGEGRDVETSDEIEDRLEALGYK
ncbi:sulfatase [Halosimplex pelagicum]|uniref:Sulfatase n=2 Tax=Halosimplex pelagicum TaxID=869886 RepID=A0A7D5T8I0_9EURY|nr:sulfatase [Halosimplex pelagicum]